MHSIHLSQLASITLEPFDVTDTTGILNSLASAGFAVVRVMSPETAAQRYSEFWDWLENLGSGIDRNDPSTWTAERWPDQIKGIIKSYGIGQAEFVWRCRIEEGVRRVFAGVWGVEEGELIVSYDGAGMYPVPEREGGGAAEGGMVGGADDVEEEAAGSNATNKKRKGKSAASTNNKRKQSPSSSSSKPGKLMHERDDLIKNNILTLWPHRDQHPTQKHLDCIQGVLNLRPNLDPADGGLIVYPTSHHIDWTTIDPDWQNRNSDFYRIAESWKRCGAQEARVLRADAGCMFLWDSRTVHCNRPPQPSAGGHTRAVVYICMTPRSKADASMLQKRVEAYKAFATGNHCPHRLSVNPSGGRMFKSGSLVKGSEVVAGLQREGRRFGVGDEAVRRLVGFDV
ncbi:hypothetical protein HDV00_005019 [Rhizophlyctis rosea]|nr:hypothetical protein HDV00_005019 [Rhizophlyctis rosea]